MDENDYADPLPPSRSQRPQMETLCDHCRLALGRARPKVVRYDYSPRLEARVAKLGGSVKAVRESVLRDLYRLRSSAT